MWQKAAGSSRARNPQFCESVERDRRGHGVGLGDSIEQRHSGGEGLPRLSDLAGPISSSAGLVPADALSAIRVLQTTVFKAL